MDPEPLNVYDYVKKLEQENLHVRHVLDKLCKLCNCITKALQDKNVDASTLEDMIAGYKLAYNL